MTVRIGIVGAGGISRGHAEGIGSSDGAEVSAVYDIDQARAEELAAASDAEVAPSQQALIDASDAVFICTWTAAHRETVELAAAAGKAVFCEKPLAATLADAQAMYDAVTKAGVVSQVGLPLRRVPAYAVLKHLLSDPANGRILTAWMRNGGGNRSRVVTGWRGDVALAGGGMLIEVGFHDLDMLQWLAGPLSDVSGAVAPGANVGIEDAATASFKLADGGAGSLVVWWNDAPRGLSGRRIEIACEYSSYVLHPHDKGLRLSVYGPGERRLELDPDDQVELAADAGLSLDVYSDFVHAVRDKQPASPSMADGLRVHEIIDTVYSSGVS